MAKESGSQCHHVPSMNLDVAHCAHFAPEVSGAMGSHRESLPGAVRFAVPKAQRPFNGHVFSTGYGPRRAEGSEHGASQGLQSFKLQVQLNCTRRNRLLPGGNDE